ncbi:arginine methyl transferase [Lentinula edodes]|uniref:Arginine methyl transferase n=1 Tax=Lentinula edodes TaxID=5353 RepID=A0A1Q3EDA6_LENED|nr:arginine methyl transferase [Lentinula edodes]
MERSESEETVHIFTQLGEYLIDSILRGESIDAIKLIVQEGAPLWYQTESEGMSALHAAAYMQNTELVQYLIDEGAIWNSVDNLKYTAADVALSFNNETIYTIIRNAGIRAEMLLTLLSSRSEIEEPSSLMIRSEDETAAASTNAFLKSRLNFIKDKNGQEICVVKVGDEEIGVMMGWEQGIMQETVKNLCEDHPSSDNLKVLNIGFGLGIIDTLFQALPTRPITHYIVEPHPDVLQYMKRLGWYQKPGVKILERKWQDSIQDLLEVGGFDVVYTDTFSEDYNALRGFFEHLPDLLAGPESRFSFFNGLGATNALFYDVYTHLAELHLADVGIDDRFFQLKRSYSLPSATVPASGHSERRLYETAGDIVLYLSTNQPNPPVPFELQDQMTPAVWLTRLTALANTAQRYSKPWFERIWTVTGILASLILPAVLYNVIYNHMNVRGADGNVDFARLSEMITFALFIGVFLFFFTPIAIWKFIGRKQVDRLVSKWNGADRMNYGQNASSTWKAQSPGIFRNSTILTISLPASMKPTSFHPNAYLPSYINGPIDPDASYYYPYKSEPGLPRMSVIGNVPLHIDEKRGFEDSRV